MLDVKKTMMNMLNKEFPNIVVTDTPIDNDRDSSNSKLLFAGYGDSKNIIKVIDYDNYRNFSKETIPTIDKNDLIGKNLVFNNKEYKINDYNNGVLTLSDNIYNLYEYNDYFDNLEEVNLNKDYIMVYSIYNFSKTLNKNIVAIYMRFNIDIFINDDLHNDKVNEYSSKIRKLFNRDFVILNEKNNKGNEDFAYIENPINFRVSEYNITNKILRGSILLRIYKNE